MAAGDDSVSPETLRAVMAEFATGVTVVSALFDGLRHAMTATAFCSVSLEPPLVLVCVGKASRFHPVIVGANAWAVSLLAADQDRLARHFGDRTRDLRTQFDEVPCSPAPYSQAPLPAGTRGWLDCSTFALYDGGDHTIAVGQVRRASRAPGLDAPLGYHRGGYLPAPSPGAAR